MKNIDGHKNRILLLINPKARNGEHSYEQIKKELELADYRIINLSEEEREKDSNDLIRNYSDQIDFVMIGGGDGSINMALTSLIELKLPLVIYPLGTANNLARSFKVAPGVPATLELLKAGKLQQIDVGIVNDIPFVNVAGLGLSTLVNRKVSPVLKKRIGVFAFIYTALKLAPSMNPFRAHITQGNALKLLSHSWQITVCNGKFYGAGMAIKHDATLLDGKLHCLSTEVRRWWEAFTLIPAFFSGRFQKNHEVTLLSDKEFKIETHRVFQIDVDGDIKTQTPAHFRVMPEALTILTPQEGP